MIQSQRKMLGRYKAPLAILFLSLGLAACASNLSPEDKMMVEKAQSDAEAAKMESAKANEALAAAQATNQQAMQASKDAAAAAKMAQEAAEKAARIAAELEAMYNTKLRK